MSDNREDGGLPTFDDPEQEALFARRGCLLDEYPPRGNGPQAALNSASGPGPLTKRPGRKPRRKK
jgi:hypothetical protein